MSSLQRIIINVNHSSANLIAQLRELDQLRDQLRKALVSAKKTPGRRRHGRNSVISVISPDCPIVKPPEAVEQGNRVNE